MRPEPAILAYRRRVYTQRELAALLGCHRETIMRIESGKRGVSLPILLAYFRALNVELVQSVRKWDDADKDLTREDPVDPLSRL